jgi:hypothetical protein
MVAQDIFVSGAIWLRQPTLGWLLRGCWQVRIPDVFSRALEIDHDRDLFLRSQELNFYSLTLSSCIPEFRDRPR